MAASTPFDGVCYVAIAVEVGWMPLTLLTAAQHGPAERLCYTRHRNPNKELSMITTVLSIIAAWLAYRIGCRTFDAWRAAQDGRPYHPPPQLGVDIRTNAWVSRPGSPRAAWWRTFWKTFVQ